jgi:hypothetical protein
VPGLTVTEKQHWKDRIARRIDKRIEAIAAQDPSLMERVKREARQRALDSLGLARHQAQLDEIEQQEEVLAKRKKQAQRAMLAQLRGVPPEDVDDYCYHHQSEVENAVTKRQAVHEDELLAEDERGQTILQLRQEKDDLLDTVWLATSGAQIKQLWAKVAELLGDDSTQLQRDALAIEPVPDSGS